MVRLAVPATAANLGPGYDCLGLALALYNYLELEPARRWQLVIRGEGAESLPRDESNLVWQSMEHLWRQTGTPVPCVKLTLVNGIPLGRGLGSSAAAIVGGLSLANHWLDKPLDKEELLQLAAELEGHPDNVAPALFGGLTIAWTTPAGPQFKKLTVHRGVSPLICVPDETMSTEVARSLRPLSVPHEDAIFNVSRSALLVAALIQSPELLFEATEDRLHQSYRASAMPHTGSLLAALRAEGHAAVVSGSGPSILVLCNDPAERALAAELVASRGEGRWDALMLAVDFKGATVSVRS